MTHTLFCVCVCVSLSYNCHTNLSSDSEPLLRNAYGTKHVKPLCTEGQIYLYLKIIPINIVFCMTTASLESI